MREADPNLSRWVTVKRSFFPPTLDEANNAGSVLESEMMNVMVAGGIRDGEYPNSLDPV